MSEYKRFVSYIYAYDRGVKSKNVGFAKMEVRNGECRVHVNIKGVTAAGGKELEVYLFHREQEMLLGTCMGSFAVKNGSGEFKAATAADNIGGSGLALEEMSGLLLRHKDGEARIYASGWDDHSVIPENFIPVNQRREDKETAEIALTAEKEELSAAEILPVMEAVEEELERLSARASDSAAPESQSATASIPAMPESQPATAPVSSMPEHQSATASMPAMPERQPATAPVPSMSKSQSATAPAFAMPESQPAVASIPAMPGHQPAAAPVSSMPEFQPAAAPVPAMPERQLATASVPSMPEFQSASVPAMPERQSATASVPSMPEFQSATAFMPAMPERQPMTASVPSMSERQPATASVSAMPEIQPATARVSAMPEPQPATVPMPAIPKPQPATIPAPAVPEIQPVRKPAPAMPETQPVIQPSVPPEIMPAPAAPEFQPTVQPEAEPQPMVSELRADANLHNGLWDRLENIFPKVVAFEDEAEIPCLKIDLKDLEYLPRENWGLANNSFLLHGYYNFRYLILAKLGDKQYLIGVPGMYHNNERFMAAMFGFDHFKPVKNFKPLTGHFGYWYQWIRL